MINLPKNNSAEIVKQALSFERSDRLPVFDGFWGGFVDNWREVRRQPVERIFTTPSVLDRIEFEPVSLDVRYHSFLEQVEAQREKGRAVFVKIGGSMFSPKTFEKIFLPVYRRMISTIKAAGARWVMLHCDGNLLPFLDMLIDAGIDGINPVEYSAGMDVVRLKEKYGNKLRYIGGVCNTQVLTSGDRGRIIGTHSIGPDISIEDYELYRNTVLGR